MWLLKHIGYFIAWHTYWPFRTLFTNNPIYFFKVYLPLFFNFADRKKNLMWPNLDYKELTYKEKCQNITAIIVKFKEQKRWGKLTSKERRAENIETILRCFVQPVNNKYCQKCNKDTSQIIFYCSYGLVDGYGEVLICKECESLETSYNQKVLVSPKELLKAISFYEDSIRNKFEYFVDTGERWLGGWAKMRFDTFVWLGGFCRVSDDYENLEQKLYNSFIKRGHKLK